VPRSRRACRSPQAHGRRLPGVVTRAVSGGSSRIAVGGDRGADLGSRRSRGVAGDAPVHLLGDQRAAFETGTRLTTRQLSGSGGGSPMVGLRGHGFDTRDDPHLLRLFQLFAHRLVPRWLRHPSLGQPAISRRERETSSVNRARIDRAGTGGENRTRPRGAATTSDGRPLHRPQRGRLRQRLGQATSSLFGVAVAAPVGATMVDPSNPRDHRGAPSAKRSDHCKVAD
jgi:hypothetical protein